MSIEFSCPACKQRFRVKDEFAGKTTKCTKCKAAMTVPAPPAPVLAAPADLDAFFDDALAAPPRQVGPRGAVAERAMPWVPDTFATRDRAVHRLRL